MTQVVTGGKPYLVYLLGYDQLLLPKGGRDTEKEVTTFTGFTKTRTTSTTKTDSWSVGLEISGTYGFSKISSIETKVSSSYNGSLTTSSQNEESFTRSTTEKTMYPFPPGEFRAYYQWAIDIGGYRVFLQRPIVALSDPNQKLALEAAAEAARITGYPITVLIPHNSRTSSQAGSGCEICYLDRQNVQVTSKDNVLKSFQLARDGSGLYYNFQEGGFRIGSAYATRNGDTQMGYTLFNDGADLKELIYLDRHTVKVPQNTFLTGFHLARSGGQFRYEYSYAQFQFDGKKLCYDSDDVHRDTTPENEGGNKHIDYLDRHHVRASDGCVLLGFHVNRTQGNYFHIEFWYLPVDRISLV